MHTTNLDIIHINLRYTHTHTHPFNGPLSGTTRVSQYQNGKTIWILLKQETVSGSGISWAICKSAPRSREIIMPAPHHSVFYRPDVFLTPNQRCQSTEGTCVSCWNFTNVIYLCHPKQLVHMNMRSKDVQMAIVLIPTACLTNIDTSNNYIWTIHQKNSENSNI